MGSRADQETLLSLLREQERRIKYNQLDRYKPQQKQKDYHNADKPDVCLGAGNQLGKTFAAAHDIAYHMTGLYPDWWTGDRFKKPPKIWICGKTTEVVRDSIQTLVLGGWENDGMMGSGAIPRHLVTKIVKRMGMQGAVDTFMVKHISGGFSRGQFKSYDMGREKFQAATLDKVYYDEEPPADIYSEGRTRTNKGQLGNNTSLTFTPLLGMTEVVMQFYQDPKPNQQLVQFTILEAEHYTAEEKKAIIDSYPEHEREARANGVPILGSGRVFAIAEELIKEPHILDIPSHWRRINGLDFGGADHPTAAAQIAYDPDLDIIHVIRGAKVYGMTDIATPAVVALSVNKWGGTMKDIPTAWPHDGLIHDKGSMKQMAKQYRDAGLNMLQDHATNEAGGNGVEAALAEMYTRMREGRLKVDENIVDFFDEFRLFHRKGGKIVKIRDDLISAIRYAIMMLRFAVSEQELSINNSTELVFTSDFG